MQPSPGDLARLAQKYRTLGDLRRARARGEPIPERDVFRAIAGEFPGALSELDTLPLEEIDRRAERLAEAASGGPEGGALEPWMAWLYAYHALMRAALHVRLRAARAKGKERDQRDQRDERDPRDEHDERDAPLAASLAATLADKASERSGVRVDAAFAQAVARPPGGRISAVIYGRLSAIFGVPALTVKRAIFPGLRDRIM